MNERMDTYGAGYESESAQLIPAAVAFEGYQFYKARESGGGGCVSVAWKEDGSVLVGDSKNPEQTPLEFNAEEWRIFMDAAENFRQPPGHGMTSLVDFH